MASLRLCAYLTLSLAAPPAVLSAQSATCGDPLAFQVLLDRHGFSPGQIDGKAGGNTARALSAFQAKSGLPATGTFDCQTWKALEGEVTPATTTYTISAEDAAGPFTKEIPSELPAQAALPALGYRTLAERIAERFHAAPALVARLNGSIPLASGSTITVPNVTPFDERAKPVRDTAAANVTLEVSRENTLRVVGADGTVLFFAPVSSGSQHDPLPIGTWKVTAVGWLPVFHYNPDLFWDAKSTDAKATIKPGPNNPVGVVWIDIDVEHYGIHGTPEPSRIGYAQSHGCVRLTNWDAARVATLVGTGTPVVFR